MINISIFICLRVIPAALPGTFSWKILGFGNVEGGSRNVKGWVGSLQSNSKVTESQSFQFHPIPKKLSNFESFKNWSFQSSKGSKCQRFNNPVHVCWSICLSHFQNFEEFIKRIFRIVRFQSFPNFQKVGFPTFWDFQN